MSAKEPIVSTSRIITLLESNDVSKSNTNGQWSNNLAEETILEEGDSIVVRNSMIDTTNESTGIIEVIEGEETEITIQYGMYLQDSGNGQENGGNAQTIDFLNFSEDDTSSPSGKNYILQNHTTGLPFTEMWYLAGAQPPGPLSGNVNPGADPADSFSIRFIPSTGAGDWWEYTIEAGAVYAPAVGIPFPNPPNGTTSPIIKSENLQGLKCILASGHVGNKPFAYYDVYANGFTPASASGKPDPVKDHIARIEVLYDGNNNPIGYQSTPNGAAYFDPNPAVADVNQWVFRTATEVGGGGTAYQYWLNYDPVTFRESKIYKVCTGFYMIVDNFANLTKSTQPNSTYQTTLTYTSFDGREERARMNFTDWGLASGVVYDSLFGPYVANPQPPTGLPDISTVKNRKKNGFEAQYSDGELFWVKFEQLTDPRNPLFRVFEPFVYDVSKGIRALPLAGDPPRGQSGGSPFAFGIYNPGQPGGTSNAFLSINQIISKALPLPNADGVVLTPRIFTEKITIGSGKYTYDALAQELTDQLNKIPRVVPQLNNNPFSATPPANNPIGFSGSRLLTSTYEIGMQQTNDAVADRVPFFPSDFVWTAGDAAAYPLLQPIWLDEAGEHCCQFDETSLAGVDNPRWCGAEALSFIYDETSDTFQVAQAHTNMYSRLTGGVIARQFKVGVGADQYVTADKMGGIFLTSLQPESLFYDKMKLEVHHAGIVVEQLANSPTLRDLKTGSIETLIQQNVNLNNALCHSISLVKGVNITGNFVGLASKIDKRTRIVAPTATDPPLVIGGAYGAVRTQWDLDVATDTPITMKGFPITGAEITDPFFQVEISGINRQDVVGAETKNNLIQTIVGKYYTNGGFTAGNIDDGFRYTHLGEPLLLRSMDIRILDSNGTPASGLGPNTAIILEVDSDK